MCVCVSRNPIVPLVGNDMPTLTHTHINTFFDTASSSSSLSTRHRVSHFVAKQSPKTRNDAHTHSRHPKPPPPKISVRNLANGRAAAAAAAAAPKTRNAQRATYLNTHTMCRETRDSFAGNNINCPRVFEEIYYTPRTRARASRSALRQPPPPLFALPAYRVRDARTHALAEERVGHLYGTRRRCYMQYEGPASERVCLVCVCGSL